MRDAPGDVEWIKLEVSLDGRRKALELWQHATAET
jgi:hypothetical protein